MKTNIVVTGFEPFGGATVNASWEAVRRLSGVKKALLPVSFDRAAQAVRALAGAAPDAVICVGEAGGRSAISVERAAINLMDARLPDNDGAQPCDVPVRQDGPAAYFATLPTRCVVERVRAAGLPAELSYTAGTYVCNATFYALMDALQGLECPCLGGFIHVPSQGMAAEDIARGLQIAVACVEAALKGE